MEGVLIILIIFGSIFGGGALKSYINGRNKLLLLREQRALAEAQRPAALPPPPPLDPNAAAALAFRLPPSAREQAVRILSLVADAPCTLDTRSQYLLKQTQADYLPSTLRSYLDLTAFGRQHLAQQGMDADVLLREQLELIEQGARQALLLDHAAAERMLSQGRFLRERFEAPAPELSLSKS